MEFSEISSNQPVCSVCLQTPFLPVTTNLFKKVKEKWKKETIIYDKKCPASLNSMNCLSCTREWREKSRKNNYYSCPNGCCKGIPLPRKLNMTYGSSKRELEDMAEPEIWPALYGRGILGNICNKCGEESNNFDEIILHQKIKCPKRKVMCQVWKIMVSFDKIDDHKNKCKGFNFKIFV